MNALCKIFLLICTMILLWGLPGSKAQNPSDIRRTYHWYFGNGAGLDFSNGDPVPLTDGAMHAPEGCATISDTCGNLLFYTDGDTVWNKNHQVMPNGTGLMGCPSSTQSSLIVPQPGNDSIYYIFLTDCAENLGANGLRYSVVNLNLDGGMGSVIEKNTLLYAPSMEKLAATYHANGEDVWILSVKGFPTGPPPPDTTYQYYAFLLTASGIDLTPVISGSAIHPHKSVGAYMRFSHFGDKLGVVFPSLNWPFIDTIELLDFSVSTGDLFNTLLLIPSQDTNDIPYGLVFSPDDTKMYTSTWDAISPFPNWPSKVFQYDLTVWDTDSIASSQTLLHYSDSTDPLLQHFMALQTGSNGKVYVSRWNNAGSGGHPTTLDVITNPNVTGPACGYSEDGVDIGGNSQAGLPNFVDSYFRGGWQPVCSVGAEEDNTPTGLSVWPNPANDFLFIKGLPNTKTSQIKMYNLLGDLILQVNILSGSKKIDLNTLASGIYFLQVQSNNSMSNFKIIKQ